jgi:hypothetical protein
MEDKILAKHLATGSHKETKAPREDIYFALIYLKG